MELYRKGIPLVGIPKTIDNDIMATDITFGFDTALHTATEAIDKLRTTAESHHRVMVVEVMGRNSGWIALQSGIAGGGDVILIPEIPFSFENVVRKIMERKKRGKKFSIVVVAEGTPHPEKGVIYKETGNGNRVLGGIGELVAGEIESRTGMETRVTVLGHLQRGGSPSPFDRILATRFGVKAVEMVADGDFGRMACLRTPRICSVDLLEAVCKQKKVPPDGEMVMYAKSVGTSFGDE
ncbi:6-phosphofructokinase [Candidatus Solincola sp.]